MADELDQQRGVSRREALRKMAIAGGVAWTIPAVQTINMSRALAQNASPVENCFTVKLDPTDEPVCDPYFFGGDPCVPNPIESPDCACGKITLNDSASGAPWKFTIGNDCRLQAVGVKGGPGCIDRNVTSLGGGVFQVDNPGRPDISHLDITFCCETC